MWLWGLKMCHVYPVATTIATRVRVCNSSCLPTEGPLYRNDKSAPTAARARPRVRG